MTRLEIAVEAISYDFLSPEKLRNSIRDIILFYWIDENMRICAEKKSHIIKLISILKIGNPTLHRHKTTHEMVAEGQKHVKNLDISKDIGEIPNDNVLELRQIKGQLKQIRNTLLSSLGQIDSLLKNIS